MVVPLVGPVCVNGNLRTANVHVQTKSWEEAIGHYDRMGCDCEG